MAASASKPHPLTNGPAATSSTFSTPLASSTTSSPATTTTPQSNLLAQQHRPHGKKLVASEALERYLTYEDRRDRSFMAILAAFSSLNNQALCVKELVDVVRDNQLLSLGGATPSGTINSAIRNHINRCTERNSPSFSLLFPLPRAAIVIHQSCSMAWVSTHAPRAFPIGLLYGSKLKSA
ncbi:hypothetical protein DL93DRAFT_1752905 [Clavulina sp. PMI_390]|nr:hypothetical protein DL93DRAFT_1752905 [Clavulina sp. PMI_390]